MRHNSGKPDDSGIAAVELAILIPALLLLIFGILEFGHAWYIKQTITSASREGARYGVVYRNVPGTSTRLSPLNFGNYPPLTSIGTVVDNYLGQFFDINEKFWTVTPTLALGTGTTKPDAGNILTVTVAAPKHWYVLGGLVHGMEDITITASTTMQLE